VLKKRGREMLDKGYIQVYTGNGKGKTTASLGLALRAVCAGYKVYMGQFMKGRDYSELMAPSLLPGFTLEQYGSPEFLTGEPTEKDYERAENGLKKIMEVISSGEYDVVIMDEINTALHFNLLKTEDVLKILDAKPEKMELVLTGRYGKDEIIEKADLVTEMKEIKHYYQKGVPSRRGIEN